MYHEILFCVLVLIFSNAKFLTNELLLNDWSRIYASARYSIMLGGHLIILVLCVIYKAAILYFLIRFFNARRFDATELGFCVKRLVNEKWMQKISLSKTGHVKTLWTFILRNFSQ